MKGKHGKGMSASEMGMSSAEHAKMMSSGSKAMKPAKAKKAKNRGKY